MMGEGPRLAQVFEEAHMIILFDRRSLAVVFTAIALTAIAGIACGAKPEKEFPEFKAEKSQIGEIALLTDVVVVEDVLGNTEKVYLEDCKRLADIMLQTFRDGLAPKGYTFRRSTVLSIGDLVNPKSQYRVLQTWVQHKEDDSQFPVTEPPFYEDSTVAAVSGGHEALRAVLNGTWTFKISKKEPPPTLSEISTLHDAIGTDYALLVVVLGTKVPVGKQMGQGMLSQLMTVGGTARGR